MVRVSGEGEGTASGDFDCLGIHRCCIVLAISSPLPFLGGCKDHGLLASQTWPILPPTHAF